MQVVAPGPVNTDMLRLERETTAAVPAAATYVRSAGRHIGYEPAAVPYPLHAYNTCAPHHLCCCRSVSPRLG